MGLRSKLFRGDAKLEAAATVDSAHIMTGAVGPHVEKIQIALNRLERAGLDEDGIYGNRTANAVLAYKRKRNIVNRAYQTTADSIVGKMTVAALDGELADVEPTGPLVLTVYGAQSTAAAPGHHRHHQPLSRLSARGAKSVRDAPGASPAPGLVMPTSFTRWLPGTTGRIRCQQTGGNSVATCSLLDDPTLKKPIPSKAAFLSDLKQPGNNIGQFPGLQDGGTVNLTDEPHFMRFETFRPGDAMIVVRRPSDVNVRVLHVEVRAEKLLPVAGSPLTKPTAGSRFFSANSKEGGEGSDPEGVFGGRPINYRRGGRLINLGGEQETPEFEDYQVDLTHSAFSNVKLPGFRPWTDDTKAGVRVEAKSASHITMRGTPLFDTFFEVIKRIAGDKCLFTFNGNKSHLAKIRTLPGKELEMQPDGTTFVSVAWEFP